MGEMLPPISVDAREERGEGKQKEKEKERENKTFLYRNNSDHCCP